MFMVKLVVYSLPLRLRGMVSLLCVRTHKLCVCMYRKQLRTHNTTEAV